MLLCTLYIQNYKNTEEKMADDLVLKFKNMLGF